MRSVHLFLAVLLGALAAPAIGGPPFLTDDPLPTDTGHWEIYAFSQGEGRSSSIDGDLGLDLNYGAANGVQLTATLPLSFTHEGSTGWRSGAGDVELGLKYRLLHDESRGFSVAVFPRVILPTGSNAPGEKAQFFLPLWLGKDFKDGTSIFGGGGYLINPGRGKRSPWEAALALTRELDEAATVGAEITREGPDVEGGTPKTRAGVGSIIRLSKHSDLLVSGGPTFADHRTGYHFYAALGLNY